MIPVSAAIIRTIVRSIPTQSLPYVESVERNTGKEESTKMTHSLNVY